MNFFKKRQCTSAAMKAFTVPDVLGDGPIYVKSNYFIYSHWSKNGSQTDQGPTLLSSEGEVIWKTKMPAKDLYNSVRSLPLYHNDTIFCVTRGYLIAFKSDNGNVLWERKLSGIRYYSIPVSYNDYILLNCETEIFILNIETGKTVKKLPISTFGTLSINNDILFCRKEKEIVGINLNDFTETINIPATTLTQNDIRSNVLIHENQIFFGTKNLFGSQSIACFNRDDFKFKWCSMTESGMIILAASLEYIIATNGKDSISCLNIKDGICRWTWKAYENLSGSIGNAVICQDVVYLTYNDNMGEQLKAFQIETGKNIWTIQDVRWTSYPLPDEDSIVIQHTFNNGNRLVKYGA